jgi:hypothetical protein
LNGLGLEQHFQFRLGDIQFEQFSFVELLSSVFTFALVDSGVWAANPRCVPPATSTARADDRHHLKIKLCFITRLKRTQHDERGERAVCRHTTAIRKIPDRRRQRKRPERDRLSNEGRSARRKCRAIGELPEACKLRRSRGGRNENGCGIRGRISGPHPHGQRQQRNGERL